MGRELSANDCAFKIQMKKKKEKKLGFAAFFGRHLNYIFILTH